MFDGFTASARIGMWMFVVGLLVVAVVFLVTAGWNDWLIAIVGVLFLNAMVWGFMETVMGRLVEIRDELKRIRETLIERDDPGTTTPPTWPG